MSLLPKWRRPAAPALLGAFLALSGCGGGGSGPTAPASITLSPTTINFTAVGQTQQIAPTITDDRGDPVDPATADWTSSTPAVASVSATGLVTSTGPGMAQIAAAVGQIEAVVQITVVQSPANFEAVSGNAQAGPAGEALLQPQVVEVTDLLGSPIAGLAVSFAVTEGGGSVQPAVATTGANGRASTVLTLGPAPGPHTVTATITGTAFEATFTATAIPAFDIQIRYLTPPSAAQAAAFASAESRWETIITGDLPDLLANAPAGSCGSNSPQISELVDDLIIFVTLEPIDGPGAVLGSAGPCFVRVPGNLTVIGQMRFDTDDLDLLGEGDLLRTVILHEMGHVLGVGTLWTPLGLLTGAGTADPHFTGPLAIQAFDAAGGGSFLGSKVPVEGEGGPGTADSHWRESVFGTELMTGFLSFGLNPLSAVTIQSLDDLGYAVNPAFADAFTFEPSMRAGGLPGGIALHDDIARGPIYGIDAGGTVVGEVLR
ncbi:MAG TPA: leishmanolysin-related zinc metalloendopeptidase [Gemmatimonadales bacterium]|nr:leishmanolysin-related zinc metalloendopeptidase [Gemmatimonadales bacterium]